MTDEDRWKIPKHQRESAERWLPALRATIENARPLPTTKEEQGDKCQ